VLKKYGLAILIHAVRPVNFVNFREEDFWDRLAENNAVSNTNEWKVSLDISGWYMITDIISVILA
jgi:hypothetical protein